MKILDKRSIWKKLLISFFSERILIWKEGKVLRLVEGLIWQDVIQQAEKLVSYLQSEFSESNSSYYDDWKVLCLNKSWKT